MFFVEKSEYYFFIKNYEKNVTCFFAFIGLKSNDTTIKKKMSSLVVKEPNNDGKLWKFLTSFLINFSA